MRVKIGNTWYNSADTAICVELADSDKVNIADTPPPNLTKYAVFPKHNQLSDTEKLAWMD